MRGSSYSSFTISLWFASYLTSSHTLPDLAAKESCWPTEHVPSRLRGKGCIWHHHFHAIAQGLSRWPCCHHTPGSHGADTPWRPPGNTHSKPHPVSSWITNIHPGRKGNAEGVTAQTCIKRGQWWWLQNEQTSSWEATAGSIEKKGGSLQLVPGGTCLGCPLNHIPFLAMGSGKGQTGFRPTIHWGFSWLELYYMGHQACSRWWRIGEEVRSEFNICH